MRAAENLGRFTVIAAALLRQLWAVVTTGQAWDPARASNGLMRIEEAIVA